MQRRDEEKQKQREDRARQKRIVELEAQIEEHETLLNALEQRMTDPDFFRDAEASRNASEEHDILTRKLSAFYVEWEAIQGEIAV
jgi:ATP-binding cassette subfamily F protein 3